MVKTPLTRVLFRHTLSKVMMGVFAVFGVMVLVTSVAAVFSFTRAQRVEAAAAKTLNFQARLLNSSGAIVPDGTYNVEFKLYKSLASGASAQGVCSGGATDDCQWVETRTGANKVAVRAGYLSVYLGDVNSLPANIWNQQLYLTMNIGGTGAASWDGEMSPRLRLTAVPAAYSLVNSNATYSSTLTLADATAGDQTFIVPNQGVSGANTFNLLTGGAGFTTATTGVVLQSGDIGTTTQQTGSFNISGIGLAASQLQTALLDTPSGTTTLNIGTTNASAGINLNQNTTLAADKTLSLSAAASTTVLQNFRVTADTNPRFTIGADGKLSFGPGNAGSDVNLSRSGAGTLRVTGGFEVTGNAAISTTTTNRTAIGAGFANNTKLTVNTDQAGYVGLAVRGFSSQSSDLLQLQNSNNATLSGFNANGALFTNGTANVISGFAYPRNVVVNNVGTAGSMTYGYRISAINSQGETTASPTTTTTTGNATLSGTNYNHITWDASAGAASYKVYGRTSGSELLMATITSTGAASYSYDDTGAATPGGALPTGNGFNPVLKVVGSNTSADMLQLYGKNAAGDFSQLAISVDNGGHLATRSYVSLDNTLSSGTSVLNVRNLGSTTVATNIQGAANQTADLLHFNAVNGEVLSGITSSGGVYTNGTNNTFAGLATPTQTTTSTGSNYYYVITATNAAGETVASNAIGMANNTSAITWNQVAGATGYKVYRHATTNDFSSATCTSAGGCLIQTISNGTTLSFTDTAVALQAGAPPTAPTGTGLTVRAWSGQSGDVLSVYDASGVKAVSVDGNGNLNLTTRTVSAANARVATTTSGQVALTVKGVSGQASDLLQFLDNSNNTYSSFNGQGNQLTLGTTGTSLLGGATAQKGKIVFGDGSLNGWTTTLQTNALTVGSQVINIPDTAGAGGTICLQNSTACGFAPASGANYIAKNSHDTSSASYVGNLLDLTNSNTGAAGVLSLTNAGTNSALSITQSGNPSAGQALIYANNSNGTPSGNLIDLRSGGTSRLTVDVAGNTTLGGTLSVAGITNSGASLNTAQALSNFVADGNIGLAAATVDIYSTFTINQTTAGRILGLPNPTTATAGRLIYIANIGSQPFTMHSVSIQAGKAQMYIWNGTAWTATNIDGAGNGVTLIGGIDGLAKVANGAAISGNAIHLQTADATYPGLVSAGDQTFGGNKIFNGNVTIGDATTDRLTVTSQILGQDALVFQGATDNGFTTTFRVTDPTVNNIITFPNETGTVCTTGSVCTGYAPSTGGANYIWNGTATQTANFNIQSAASGSVAATIQGAASQTVSILEVKANSVTNPLLSVGSTGAVTMRNSADSANALSLQNQNGEANVVAGTTNLYTNLVTDSSFESGVTGWSAKAGAGAPVQSSVQKLYDSNSLRFTTTGVNQGVSYAVTLNPSTTYTLVTNIRFSATTGAFVTLGRQEVSGTDITCATAQTAYTSGWARISCTFTTGATITAPTSIYIIQTDATARTIYVDGVSLTAVSQAAMLYAQGTLRVNSLITSPIAIRPTEDTTRALSVVNAAGTSTVFSVDSVNGTATVSSTVTAGAFSATGTTTGSSLNIGGTGMTTGNGYLFNTTANGLTSGKAINITGAAGGITADFSGSYINVTPTRTLTAAATRTDSGTFLNLTRANTVNNAGATYNVTGALANLQSTCTQTSGTCNDSGVILNLNQQYGSATGTVLNVTGAGTGNLGVFDATNTGANGVSIDIQSNSSSQYVFRATSNNGATTGLNVRADGRVSIGNTSPSAELDVTGNGIFSGTLTSGAHTVQTATVTDDQIIMGVTAGGGARFAGTITNADLTAARTYTLQDNSGIIPLSTAGNSLFFTTSGATSLSLPTSGTVCTTATCATTPASGYYLQQVPTSNTAGAAAANVVSPVDDGIIGLTVNGTTGAAATALSVVQTGAATGIAVSNSSTGTGLTISGSSTGNGASITSTNTSGVQTNGLSITRNGAGGTTTNLLNIGNAAGTATSLINLTNSGTTTNALAVSSGTFTTGFNLNGATFTNLIDSANFDVANSGNITNSGTYNTNTFNSTALTFGGAGATTIQSAASQTLNITGHANSTWSTDAGTLTLQGFAGTNVNTPNSAAGATSAVALLTGNATVSGNSGAITLTTGNSTAATAGNITLDVGTSAVSNGSILIGTAARAQTITIGNATGGNITVGQNGGTVAINGTNFDVSTAGVVTLMGGQATDITTASAATATAIAVQPGTSTAATGTGANATIKAGDQSGTTNSTGGTLTLQGGSATGGAGTRTGGNVSIQAGTGNTANGAINIGTTAASAVTVGNSSATQIVLQGNASSTFSATNATGTTVLGFAAPSTAGTVTFQLPADGTADNTYDICTTLSVCAGYQAAGSYISSSLTDNTANALDIQEGTNNYININTTNGSENISFGNAATNPSYNFLGTGTLSVSGVLSANGGVLFPGDNFLQTSSSNKLSDTTGIILPLYIYPTNVYTNSDYNNVIALAKKYHNVPLTVILNPASGPGSSADANYTAAIARLHGAGVKILGYVDTNYTAVAEATVRSDIDMWRTLYPAVDGIFFDRTTNDANATHYTYYTNLTAYAHSKSYYPTMINPGVAVPQGYFDNKTADIINVYENSSYPSEATMQGDWAGGNSDYNYNRRSAMVYNQGFNYTNLKMMRKYVGNLYLTDSSGANPWATLSTYLETEFRALSTDGDLIVDTLNAQTGVLTASVDTATATTLSLGTTTANGVNISRAGVTTTVQGSLSVTQAADFDGNVTIGDATTDRLTVTSQIQGQDALVFQGATDNGFTTTFRVTDPTANNIITFPNETGTVCTTGSVCTGYAPSTGGNYLAKNATDTNSFAVTASNYLYGFTNSSSAVDSGVLSLNNGTNTGNGLYVTASGNPAAGRALIFASNTNASPTGNLIDLQSGSTPTSKFSVTAAGNVTSVGTYNTATISGGTLSTTAVNSLNVSGTAISGTGALSVDSSGANALSLNGTATGDINLGGGSASTGCTVTNATGAFACSGNINTTGGQYQLNGTQISSAALSNDSNLAKLDTAQTFSASNTFSATSNAIILSGTPASGSTLLRFDGNNLSGGSANGTYIGANPGSFSGDFINLQVGNTSVLKVTNTGALSLGDNLTIPSGRTMTYQYNASLQGTVTAQSGGSNQYGLQNEPRFQPSSAITGTVYGLVNTATLQGTSVNVNKLVGSHTHVTVNSSYTGGAMAGGVYGFEVGAPQSDGSIALGTYGGIYVANNTVNGNGMTSGTVNNYQVRVGGVSATQGAGSTGTLNNYGVNLTVPSSGTNGTNNNYGLYIQGNGGTGGTTTNYAIYSSSTAASVLMGGLTISDGAGVSSGTVTMTAANGAFTFTTSSNTSLSAGDYIVPTTSTAQARTITHVTSATSYVVSSAFTGNVTAETYTVYHPTNTVVATSNNNGIHIATTGTNTNALEVYSSTTGYLTAVLDNTGDLLLGNPRVATGGSVAFADGQASGFTSTITMNGTLTGNQSVYLPNNVSGTMLLVQSSGPTAQTGNIAVNGTVQVGSGTAGTGAFVNNGTTLNSVYNIANLATGGWDAGGAAATVDKFTAITVTQTTSGQTLTVPSPTATTAGKIVYVSNTGSASFILQAGTTSTALNIGSTATLVWNGTAWTFAGAGTGNLQSAYTSSAGGSTSEIILDSTRGGLDFQDRSTSNGGTLGATAALLNVRATAANDTTAGASLFVVNASGKVGINNGGTSSTPALSYDLSFGSGASRTIGVEANTSNAAGYGLTVSAGAAGYTTANNGGALTLQGGSAAGAGNANGGGVILTGGAGTGTGTLGLVSLAPTAFAYSGANQSFSADGSITGIDSYSTIAVTATGNYRVTVPVPTIQTVGRIVYISAVNGANDFILALSNTSGVTTSYTTITMKANNTATLVWNGYAWTAAGASSATDLQAAYDNTASTAGAAELILKNTATSNGLTIRNGTGANEITGGLLEVQTAIGSNLFSVNSNATEYANNGGAESSTFTMWTGAPAGGTISRYTTVGNNIATGVASVFVDTATAVANTGVKNTLATSLTANLKYTVSFTARHTSSTVDFNTMDVYYSVDGTAYSVACATGQTVTYGAWKRINCSFTAPSSGITAANAIIIRHSDTTEHDFYIDNLSVTVSADVNHAVDGSVDAPLGTNWAVIGAGSVTRNTSTMYDSSGSVQATTSGVSGRGVYNNLSNGIVPTQSATGVQYRVTAYMRGDGTNGLTAAINYSPNAGTTLIPCTDYSTQSIAASTWTKVTCLFTTNNTAVTTAQLRVTQTAGTATNFYIDALVIALNQNTASNVQIGGGSKGGPATLFTLDRSSTAPIADNNDAYLGSMYYDTTTGRIQCYEADGWGACGASPDNIVNLNPEYTGAVLNGSGVGTMTADFCGNGGGLSVNTSLCSSGQARNFYKWTSPQPTQQTYSIYVTYQLPATFKGFASDDTVRLVGRVDNTSNASVTYEMFKSDGTTVTQCYNGPTETNVITGGGGAANTWYSYGINGNEATGCSFNASSASNFVIFKINMKAQSNASAYVSTLSFTTTGQ